MTRRALLSSIILIILISACRPKPAPRQILLDLAATKSGLEPLPTRQPPPSPAPLIPTVTFQPSATPRPRVTQLPTPTLPPLEPIQVEGYLGDMSEGDGIGMAALQLTDPGIPGPLFGPLPGLRMVAVQVLTRNYQAKPFRVEGAAFNMVDRQGRTYHPDQSALEPVFQTVVLNAGEQTLVWLGFQIPEQAELSHILAALPANQKLEISLISPPEEYAPQSKALGPFDPGNAWGLPALGGGLELEAIRFEDPAPGLPTYRARPNTRLVAIHLSAANISQERLDLDLTRAFFSGPKRQCLPRGIAGQG